MNPFKEYVATLESAHTEEEFEKYQRAFNEYRRIVVLGNRSSP